LAARSSWVIFRNVRKALMLLPMIFCNFMG
jgi:hypothetical protein